MLPSPIKCEPPLKIHSRGDTDLQTTSNRCQFVLHFRQIPGSKHSIHLANMSLSLPLHKHTDGTGSEPT